MLRLAYPGALKSRTHQIQQGFMKMMAGGPFLMTSLVSLALGTRRFRSGAPGISETVNP